MDTPHSRYDFLDWLRVIAIFVLVFFHTGMIFVGWGWHIQNTETLDWLKIPMDISHRLRMPLLFVIAGAGLWFALKSRSGLQVLGERSVRLLLPVVAGMFLIVPPQIYFERLADGEWSGGYWSFMVERVFQFVPYPKGDFSWHHLWFVVYLYVYVLLLLPLLLWWRNRKASIRPGAWIWLLAIPLGVNEALLKPLFPESHTLVSDWYTFNHYLLLTLYGFALASAAGVWDWIATRRRYFGICAFGTLAMLGLAFKFKIAAHDTVFDFFFANVFTWLTLLAFIGYGRTHLSFENKLLRWARDASYPIYILHQTIIVAIGYYVVQQPWTAGNKYLVVLLSTFLVCVALYQYVVKQTPLTRVLFGMKPSPSRKRRDGRGTPLVAEGGA